MPWNLTVFDSRGLIKNVPPRSFEGAFPTAVGFGAAATGGRGGTVYKVTNLNDSGTGSFREACTATGARYVLFEVSGWINLTSSIQIDNDNITIAGQTSPGGIGVTGAPVRIHADHVIVRHMRFRAGSHSSYPKDQLDSLQVWGPDNGTTAGPSPTTNVIIDHCSIGWAVDECCETAYDVGDVTFQKCVFHEGLTNAGHSEGNHSMGFLGWGKYAPQMRLTFFQNYFCNSKDRQPEVNIGISGSEILVDMVNNVTYNTFGGFGQKINGSYIDANVVHNFVKGGPQSNSNFYETTLGSDLVPARADTLYVFGNMGQNRLEQGVGSEWLVGESWRYILQSEDWRKSTPHTLPYTVNPGIMSPTLAATIVAQAGATVPVQDSVDQKNITEFNNDTGTTRSNVTYPDDFPTFSGTPPTDTSGDGIPDAWAIGKGLDHTQDNANGNQLNSHYTNLEMYLNELAGDY